MAATAKATYASVALLGVVDVQSSIEQLEDRGIVPSLTSVCGSCGRVSVVLYDGARDAFAHTLGLWARYGRFMSERP